jgi:hypothetical protein
MALMRLQKIDYTNTDGNRMMRWDWTIPTNDLTRSMPSGASLCVKREADDAYTARVVYMF